MTGGRLHLFEATGVELEYMIVDQKSLAVKPIADELLRAVAGRYESEVEFADVAWSNELALHLIELKTNGPSPSLLGLGERFQAHVRRVNELLAPRGARLMPTAMHPWMDPARELRLWPHEASPIYEAFDRIFDCTGQGWANLQSVHLNLPFANDSEFGRLHAAIRVLLPLLPALAASSPVVGGRLTGMLDTRLEYYRTNSRRVPSVAGLVVPEPIFTQAEYEGRLLRRIYDDLAPWDPGGILRHEWVNARGCIARFDRGSIEIRILDVQECPRADLAVGAAVIAAVRGLVEERFAPLSAQREAETGPLAALFRELARDADEARIGDADYLRLLGWRGRVPCAARDLWSHLIEETLAREPGRSKWEPALGVVLGEGCLARRIVRRLDGELRPERLTEVYGELCRCLADGVLFPPA